MTISRDMSGVRGLALLVAQALSARHGVDPPRERSGRRLHPGNWWRFYAFAGALLGVLFFIVSASALANNLVYETIGLSAVVAILAGVRLHRPSRATAWCLLALSQFLFVAGDVVWAIYQLVLRQPAPFPSWADALYLLGYPALAASVLLFVRVRSSGKDIPALIDAAIVATTAAAYTWTFLIEPYAADASLSIPERLVSVAYPVGDLAVLAVAVRFAIHLGRHNLSHLLLIASPALLLAADAQYAVQVLAGSYTGGLTTDGFWITSYVLFGCAALHPSMRSMTQPSPTRRTASTKWRLFILTTALLLMPLALGLQVSTGHLAGAFVVLGAACVMALLVLARMRLLIGDVESKVEELERSGGVLRAALAEREALSEQLRQQALHDPLTGAANRLLLADRAGQALARRDRTGEPVSVLFLDLDDFKSVNDRLGHAAGDSVLTAAAGRIHRCVRPADTVARIGGDEFAVLLEGADASEAAVVADRIIGELGSPLRVGDDFVVVRASIGIAESSDGADADALLRKADLAMYDAKGRGKDRSEVFDARMQTTQLQQQHARGDVKRALESRELSVHFRPIVDLQSGRIAGAQALARWLHPQKGLLGADQFIPSVQESALICDIELYVLEEALRQNALWRQEHDEHFRVVVDLSPLHVQQGELGEKVSRFLGDFRLPGGALVLAVTADALSTHSDALREQLHGLRALGVWLALDDSRTGFSSFERLRGLPVDALEIDGSSIGDKRGESHAAALAREVHELEESPGLVTIAMGVEREAEARLLVDLGCHWAQGDLFGRPQPADAIDLLLSRPPAQSWGPEKAESRALA
jgi:diguanylate cyclase (GGDEF)-like protein